VWRGSQRHRATIRQVPDTTSPLPDALSGVARVLNPAVDQPVAAEEPRPKEETTMEEKVRDYMTTDPVALQATDSVEAAAEAMRQHDIGNVLVLERDRIMGILTDRDIAVRVVAEHREPGETRLADVCSRELTTLSPDDTIEDAIAVMQNKAIRRLPVVDGGRPVGVVALGDLAPRGTTLGEISAAPPNQ
jgi:CBS domain-containing protein